MCGGWCERVARLSACSGSGVGFTFFLSFSGTSSACAWLFPATETKAAAASKAALRAKCLLVSWVVASVLPLLSCALALTTTARVALALAATGARLVIVVLVIAFMACVVYSGKALGLVVLFQLAFRSRAQRDRETQQRERERGAALRFLFVCVYPIIRSSLIQWERETRGGPRPPIRTKHLEQGNNGDREGRGKWRQEHP